MFSLTIRLRPFIAWYDLWVGLFIDMEKKQAFILPVPCVGFVLEWGEGRLNTEGLKGLIAKPGILTDEAQQRMCDDLGIYNPLGQDDNTEYCSQCGEPFEERPCGLTHQAVALGKAIKRKAHAPDEDKRGEEVEIEEDLIPDEDAPVVSPTRKRSPILPKRSFLTYKFQSETNEETD